MLPREHSLTRRNTNGFVSILPMISNSVINLKPTTDMGEDLLDTTQPIPNLDISTFPVAEQPLPLFTEPTSQPVSISSFNISLTDMYYMDHLLSPQGKEVL